ncbi:HNH endonuclease [Leptospira stimsonii]|uniref:HNH endonuclease n=1 Tax=Leptospira stimsonii TaxID=2202203 RepID=A0ABY2NEM7_9LEPT|nr:HNH endonuclease signature motif containing protein [Leptospira stimsonii]TGK18387.1 HNH endonuclease [Leptospira stimsonii]TGM22498.1 HNH endonuclease [Leptospira stimsonii]
MTIDKLQIGQELSNSQLTEIFEVGNMGGMRKSIKNNLLVLISDPFKGLYKDRWNDNILYFTGTGKSGNQLLEKQNADLANSNSSGLQIYLFEVFSPTKYFFHGKVKLHGNILKEQQEDIDGNLREVIVFPLEKLTSSHTIKIDYLKQKETLSDLDIQKKPSKEILEILQKQKSKSSSKRSVSSTYYERNTLIKELVRRRANGICELCQERAPFTDLKGNPYLEVHHIIWLSREGEDSVENTVALCPNCHRRMHIVEDQNDLAKLERLPKGLPDGV